MTGQTTLEQTKTVLLTSRILSHERVDFLGTANLENRFTSYSAHLPLCSAHLAYHKPYLSVREILLHSSDSFPASVGFLQR